ncbi:hypothetical protein E3E31_03470 [Thermococcus sp. M39]|uniref:hypothetical protein n=1 Tax=unclassified Thermococcus TaxID=2627626 RepID=UPI001439F50E|nr:MULTISPECIES: hypothetical protein [unclassified Thermococcus]NJE07590.1 hypothetical protein [Thermococcus sp. M39]NJE12174.1 hypothetical protein [Thermococcus sp. LS2]
MSVAPSRKESDLIKELIPWARHDAIVQAFNEREKERREILEMVENFQDASFLPEGAREIIGNIGKKSRD